MGLADTLKEGPPVTVKRCGVGKWLDRQGDDDRAAFEAIVPLAREHVDDWNIRKLHEVCAPNGLDVNPDALRAHLGGRCPCGTRR